jgi:uncharacterized integral membrane protein
MDNSPESQNGTGMPTRSKVKLVSGIVLVVLAIIVAMQNTRAVETRFLNFTFIMPQAGLLALTMLIGILIGILFTLVILRRRSSREDRY